jgi:DNA-binding CsgD family transcriptional regulator
VGAREGILEPATSSASKDARVTRSRTASQQIIDEVTSWPGVEAGPGERGEFSFRLGHREIGHLHGDIAAHFAFPKGVWAELTERELDVLRLLAVGQPTPEIARTLYVEVNTVRIHVKHLYGKLDVHSRDQAVWRARELSLI